MRIAGLVTLILIIAGQAPGQRVNLLRSPKARALAQAFKTGKLPEPMRLPPGNVDQQAAALAKALTKGDESATRVPASTACRRRSSLSKDRANTRSRAKSKARATIPITRT